LKTSSIALIGLPCSGKSTLGQLLARRLSLPFVDTDSVIEQQTGKKISELFLEMSEPYFRELEAKLLGELMLATEAKVIATGGGLPIYKNNMGTLLQFSRVIYLDIAREPWLIRMKKQSQKKDRPLLTSTSTTSLEDFYDKIGKEREPIYLKAQIRLSILSEETEEESLMRLLDLLV
jgi:shikimate kinase